MTDPLKRTKRRTILSDWIHPEQKAEAERKQRVHDLRKQEKAGRRRKRTKPSAGSGIS